jgi:predicted ATP-grasp superfamily ATP-dependent carboligase
MYPTDLGNSTLSVTVPMSEVSDAADSLRRLLDGLRYVGLFDAEFKYDERDGRFKILEVNARPWWQLALSKASGLDLMTMAYRDALGLPLAETEGYRVGRTWVHPVPDLRAWWSSRAGRKATAGLPLRAWCGEANAIFSWDDPMPAIGELVRVSRRALSRAGGAAGSGPR